MSLGREASARRADQYTDVRASAEREASRSERHQPPAEPGSPRREQEASRDVRIEVTVNGERHEAEVWEGESLLVTLRDRLGLPGSKNACEQGECGSCSVLLDGELVCACLVLAAQANGHAVTTVEGLAEGDRLHPVQEAFAETGAVQCGFCTPGFIVAAADLLSRIPDPNDDEIREALSGNLCRCTGYAKILDAVHEAARR